MTQEEFITKMHTKYPQELFLLIHLGEKSTDKSVVLCGNCNRRIEAANYEWFRERRKHICSKCFYKREDTIKNEQLVAEKLKGKAYNINFVMKDGKIRRNTVNYTCAFCHRVNTKDVANFLRQKEICGYCEGTKQSKNTDSFITELQIKYGNKFSLLTEYVNVSTPVTFKCNNCGFIRSLKPNSLLASGYCPKCDSKESRGEKAISKYLTTKNIRHVPQMYFSQWNIGIHYFDFYIPEYNLVLEFNGRQHYEFVNFFHKDENDYYHRLKKDREKKEAALSNGLNYASINYKLLPQINRILDYLFNSTTIPNGSRGKCLEIETVQSIG